MAKPEELDLEARVAVHEEKHKATAERLEAVEKGQNKLWEAHNNLEEKHNSFQLMIVDQFSQVKLELQKNGTDMLNAIPEWYLKQERRIQRGALTHWTKVAAIAAVVAIIVSIVALSIHGGA